MNSIIDRLIWIVFEQKCVKLITFFYFVLTDTSTLKIVVSPHFICCSQCLKD